MSIDQLSGILSSLGPAGTALAVAAVPVAGGLAAYVTRMGSQSKIDRLEGEVTRVEKGRADDLAKAEERYADLDRRHQAILRRGALLQSEIDALIAEVEEVSDQLDASDYSVLVPAPTSIPGDTPDELVFLVASGPQSAHLKWMRVPMAKSLSGQVFRSGQATIASPPPSGAAFASQADKVTNYTTNETLSVCLRYRNQRVGVAQFLNRRSGRFDADDVVRASALCAGLALRVSDFLADPRRLIEMGHAPKANKIDITVMFMDISNYSDLFQGLDSSVITDLLNQYFQELCAIAFRHGGALDQILGDGALLVFNLDQNQSHHQRAAVLAASEMLAAFAALRRRWVTLGYAGTERAFVRFGLACGPATRSELGHTQARRVTVIGPVVNAAAFACDAGPRDHDAICLEDSMKEAVLSQMEIRLAPVRSGDSASTVVEVVVGSPSS